MAYFEFRKFNFFELTSTVDGEKISEVLRQVRITASSSGNGYLVLGDSDGFVHLVKKNFEIKSFQAYVRGISLAAQAKLFPILVTIGDDEMGINPIIKVWSIDKTDKQGNPVCLRITRATIPNKAVVPSCLTINDALTFMAVGFVDGSILLFRGDLTRERTSKQKLLKDDLPSITGLAFHTSLKTTHLYVATVSSVEMYEVTHKDKESRVHLDDVGCSLGCSILGESLDESVCHFIVATNDVIYFYTNGVKGSCQIIGGEKIQLAWYRNYLVIVAKENKSKSRITTASARIMENKDSPVVSVLDLRNKIMAFTACLQDVTVLVEWGSIYAISSDHQVSLISEIDLQSKLTILFKKNLYDIGIRMARDQHYDADGLMEIFRQYGDYLYNKGDHKSAMDQYIKTIGHLEPSYVIRKYKDSQKVDILPVYLEALHKEGLANKDHTTLLLNCYTKLNKLQLLKEFILTKEKAVNFDVKVAIEVCRHVSLEDALNLAERHGYHEWYLAIQIEDQHNYDTALEYIGKLDFEQAELMMKQYCTVLLKNIPDKTTQFLKRLCSGYRPSNQPLVDQDALDSYKSPELQKAKPVEFIHYFLNNSEKLVEFLSHIQSVGKCVSQVYTTLVEHYLAMWQADESQRGLYQQKIMNLLESRDSSCDKLQALVLCKAANFSHGILYLYEQNKMYQAILNYHFQQRDYKSVVITCRRLGTQEPRLWIQALWMLASNPNLPSNLLEEVLSVIDEKKLLSPLLVIDALCASTQVGDVRKYIDTVFNNEHEAYLREKSLIDKFNRHMEKLKDTIEDIQYRPVVFQASKCCTCEKQLCLPSIHFLCHHSYHQDCYQSFSESDKDECLTCAQDNRNIIEAIIAQDETRGLAEDFHSQLDHSDDSFSLVTNYLGRGVFNKAIDLPQEAMRAAGIVPHTVKPEKGNVQAQIEKQKEDIYSYQHTFNKPGKHEVSRLTVEESPITRSLAEPERKLGPSDRISASISRAPGNPFDEDDSSDTYTAANPFDSPSNSHFEHAPSQPISTNPFDEDDDDDDNDDYDKNLNPFA